MKQTVITYIIAGLMITVVMYLVLKKLGLVGPKTEGEQAQEKAKEEVKKEKAVKENIYNIANEMGIFDVNLWKQYPDRMISDNTAVRIADQIYNAWGFWNDDEEAVYSAFNLITDPAQVSRVSDVYSKLFKADLYTDLTTKLSKTEFYNVMKIITRTTT